MTARFPRLSAAQAQRILSTRVGKSINELEESPLPSLETERFAPTGPPRVQMAVLQHLRERLTTLARSAGYPIRSEQSFRSFDGQCAILLGDFGLPPGQAIRSDTWAWIAVHLVPHLVEWRFGKSDKPASPRRYAGILQRNAIGRLWYRAHVMCEPGDNDRWSTLGFVNEDAHVAVLERTSIARNHRLARAIIRRWASNGGGEQVLRIALIRVRLQVMMLELSVLDDGQLRSVIDWAFQEARSYAERPPLPT